jgi:hypothetical protein
MQGNLTIIWYRGPKKVLTPLLISTASIQIEKNRHLWGVQTLTIRHNICSWCQSHASAEESIRSLVFYTNTLMHVNGWAKAKIYDQIPLAPGTWWEDYSYPIVEHTRRHRSISFNCPKVTLSFPGGKHFVRGCWATRPTNGHHWRHPAQVPGKISLCFCKSYVSPLQRESFHSKGSSHPWVGVQEIRSTMGSVFDWRRSEKSSARIGIELLELLREASDFKGIATGNESWFHYHYEPRETFASSRLK